MKMLNMRSLSGKLNIMLISFVVSMVVILGIFFTSINKYSTHKDQILDIEATNTKVDEVNAKVEKMMIDALKVHGLMDKPNEIVLAREKIKKDLVDAEEDIGLIFSGVNSINKFGHEAFVEPKRIQEAKKYMHEMIEYMIEHITDVAIDPKLTDDQRGNALNSATIKGVNMIEGFEAQWLELKKDLTDLKDNLIGDLKDSETIAKTSVVAIVFIVLISLGAFIIATNNTVSVAINELISVLSELAKGNAKVEFSKKAKNIEEFNSICNALDIVKVYIDKASKLQNMVEDISIPIMVCDKSFNITYMNKASKDATRTLEKHLPVSHDKLIGSNIDIFHKSPSHNRSILTDKARLPHKGTFAIGDEWMNLAASMLKDTNGDFDGAYIDWKIVTEDYNTKKSIEISLDNIGKLISSASHGDLDYRIDTAKLTGSYKQICDDLNNLMNIISAPLSNSIKVIQDLSKGSLVDKVEGDYGGMFKVIQTSLNSTIDTLKNTVIKIKESSSAVKVASSEISAGSEDLSSRTEQQASNLEETAASMEELTETVQKNTTNAANANKFAGEARQIAEKGGKVVEDAVLAMGNIEKSSQKISDIIGVIDEIAFQTNLLALNAAVEAARAGDAGKGFAVVASEVRMLAGRSSSASKEIKQLIMESATQVKDGAVLVNQAGSTLTEIVTSVKKVADLVSDIATASVEQSNGIREINSAVLQMDQMTQQNAALVQENTAASQSLVNQADNLTRLVGFFKLSEEEEARLSNMIDAASKNAKTAMQSAANNVKKPAPAGSKNIERLKADPKKDSSMNKLVNDMKKSDAAGGNASSGAYSDGWEEF